MHPISILALAGAITGLHLASAAAADAPKNRDRAPVPAVTGVANPSASSATSTGATSARLTAASATDVPMTRLAGASTAANGAEEPGTAQTSAASAHLGASAVEAPSVGLASTSIAYLAASEEAPNPALDASRTQTPLVVLHSTKEMTSLAAFRATSHEHAARLPAGIRRGQSAH
jgi:hypothetical protein